MARPKSVTKEEVVQEEKVVVTQESKIDVDKILKEKAETENKFLELQAQMQVLMQQVAMMGATPMTKAKEDVAVGCRAINGASLASKDESIEYNLKYKEVEYIPYADLKECFKSRVNDYKDLFAKGIFYFVDEENYAEFNIRDRIDMSEDNIIDILVNQGAVPFADRLYVRGQKDNTLYMAVLYLVSDLFRQGKLSDWTYTNRKQFENMFKTSIDEAVSRLEYIR